MFGFQIITERGSPEDLPCAGSYKLSIRRPYNALPLPNSKGYSKESLRAATIAAIPLQAGACRARAACHAAGSPSHTEAAIGRVSFRLPAGFRSRTLSRHRCSQRHRPPRLANFSFGVNTPPAGCRRPGRPSALGRVNRCATASQSTRLARLVELKSGQNTPTSWVVHYQDRAFRYAIRIIARSAAQDSRGPSAAELTPGRTRAASGAVTAPPDGW